MRQRPRLCRECHAPATHVEVTQRPAAVLRLDGSIRRFAERVSVFWCDSHSGVRRIGGL